MNQLPAHLQNYQSRGLAKIATQNLGTAAPPYISLRDNRFTAVDAAGNEQPVGSFEQDGNKCIKGQFPGCYLDVNIVDINPNVSRIFYDEAFDPNAQSYQPPACFSNNGVGPSKQASRPQAAFCATCPQAEWGSAVSNVSGKAIPACAQYQFIGVVIPGFPAEMAFLVRVPPNSLKNFRAYSEMFNGQSFDYDAVITRLSFPSQGTLAFCAVGYVDVPSYTLAQKLLTSGATDNLLGKNDAPRDPNSVGQLQSATQALPPPQATVPPPAQFQPQPLQPPQMAAQPPAPAAPAPAGRGRGRPRAAAQAPAPAAQPAAPAAAPFVQQPAPAAAPPPGMAFGQPAAPAQVIPPGQPGPQPGAPFGIQGGVAPNQDVQAALQGLFNR